VRILVMFYDGDDESDVKWVQIDVSREPGFWKLSRMLASVELEEVRIVGESEAAIAVARTIVIAGQYSRSLARSRSRLRMLGDEVYPRRKPFVFIDPVPDPAAFD
jgi:hypothetical protein